MNKPFFPGLVVLKAIGKIIFDLMNFRKSWEVFAHKNKSRLCFEDCSHDLIDLLWGDLINQIFVDGEKHFFEGAHLRTFGNLKKKQDSHSSQLPPIFRFASPEWDKSSTWKCFSLFPVPSNLQNSYNLVHLLVFRWVNKVFWAHQSKLLWCLSSIHRILIVFYSKITFS